MSNFYLRPADQLFKLQIPLGFGGGQALAEDGGFVHFPSEIIIMIIITRNVFVNQTLTARTVGLVGGVLAGLALALTGPLTIILSLLLSCFLSLFLSCFLA